MIKGHWHYDKALKGINWVNRIYDLSDSQDKSDKLDCYSAVCVICNKDEKLIGSCIECEVCGLLSNFYCSAVPRGRACEYYTAAILDTISLSLQ